MGKLPVAATASDVAHEKVTSGEKTNGRKKKNDATF
jgi:hypothetical protein